MVEKIFDDVLEWWAALEDATRAKKRLVSHDDTQRRLIGFVAEGGPLYIPKHILAGAGFYALPKERRDWLVLPANRKRLPGELQKWLSVE